MRLGPSSLQNIAFAIGDLDDAERLHPDALIRERRVRRRHFLKRNFRGADRRR